MAELETKNASTALYRYLCRFIIGTEEHVKTIRLLTSARDDLSSDKNTAIITSGSLGEGLVTPESDLDMMSVIKNIEVCEDNNVHFNHNMTYNIIMETDYTQPGYTRLRMKNGYRNIRELHLRNTKLCQKALRDLQMTIEDDYFIAIPYHTASSYDMLDILIRLMDDKRSER
ncbi:unnamed protein product [Mytilus edulis]|uniref:Uncharacterized protein n=1 Tax=Mytilus edulis TaxID=6550 RepID=A0A8S3QD10_MYTED|nr:unnamed protein product [Mytilus edulis]